MSDSIPKVSIVIPHWNNVEILSECLKSIDSTIYPDFEVIVVDNASTDNSVQYVKSNFPDVKLIENDRNDGYAYPSFLSFSISLTSGKLDLTY